MANRLRNMKFDEVSFVKRGANQHADVVLFKSGGCGCGTAKKGDKTCPTCGESMDSESSPKKEMSKDSSMTCDHENCVEGMNYCPDCGVDSSAIIEEYDVSPDLDDSGMSPEMGEESLDELLAAKFLSMYVQKSPGDVQTSPLTTELRSKPVISKSDLPVAVMEYIDGPADAVVTEDEFLKGIIALAADLMGDDDDEFDALSKADPEIRAIVEKAENDAAVAIAMAKSEQDLRRNAEFVAMAKEFSHLPLDADEFGPVLKSVFDNDPADYAAIDLVLKAADKGMAMLFKSAGQDTPSSLEGTSLSAIEKAAGEISTSQPELTPEQAYDAALRANPELYTDSLEG